MSKDVAYNSKSQHLPFPLPLEQRLALAAQTAVNRHTSNAARKVDDNHGMLLNRRPGIL